MWWRCWWRELSRCCSSGDGDGCVATLTGGPPHTVVAWLLVRCRQAGWLAQGWLGGCWLLAGWLADGGWWERASERVGARAGGAWRRLLPVAAAVTAAASEYLLLTPARQQLLPPSTPLSLLHPLSLLISRTAKLRAEPDTLTQLKSVKQWRQYRVLLITPWRTSSKMS